MRLLFLVAGFIALSSLVVLWKEREWNSSFSLLQTGDDTIKELSSSSLVQRAAADCASDSKCIPTVDELVNRAASFCASDPSCVCDWAKYPKKCFLSEVARHKELTHDAKELVAALKSREEAKAMQLGKLKSFDSKLHSLLAEGTEDLDSSKFEDAKKILIKAEVEHRLSEQISGGHLDLQIPLEQTHELEQFAKQIVRDEQSHRKTRKIVQNKVTTQLGRLSSQIRVLMKKVGEARRPRRSQGSRTDEEIQALTHDVAMLTGKVGELEKGSALRSVRGRTEELADSTLDSFSGHGKHDAAVQQVRDAALKHQQTALDEALHRGKLAVEKGDADKAKTALVEVQYYRGALARLRGYNEPCSSCDQLKQETDTLSNELLAPSSTTSLADEADSSADSEEHRSATALERNFDQYLAEGDRDLVQGRVGAARRALGRAKGRFAELETRRLPGADGVIKHEMRKALRALESNINSRAPAQPKVDPSEPADSPLLSRGRRHRSLEAHGTSRDHTTSSMRGRQEGRQDARDKSKAAVRAHGDLEASRGRRWRSAAAPEHAAPGSSRLLRHLLARPGFYTPKTLRMATEGLRTATLRADGTLKAVDSDTLLRIQKHFEEA